MLWQAFGRFGGLASSGGSSVGPTPTFVAVGTSDTKSSATNLAPVYPVGIAANDILLLHVHLSDSLGNASISSVTGSWTIVQDQPYVNDETAALYWKRATGSETGTETVSLSEGTNTNVASATISAWRGCPSTGTPYEADTQSSQTATTSHVGSGITTLGANRLVLTFFGWTQSGTTGSNTNGWTEVYEISTISGNGGGAAGNSLEVASAGSVSACTRTMGSSVRNVSFTLALKPA